MSQDLKKAYRTVMDDHFPKRMEIALIDEADKRQTLFYDKVSWVVDEVVKGLRYGENPGQEAALYKLVNGNLTLGETTCIQPGRYLASDMELLQSGKHPGKTNVTDADNSLNILRYFMDKPTCVIVKHNNPCGVARADSLVQAYERADLADRVAAFGGAIALNQPIDKVTAEAIIERYAEVVVAPEIEEGVMDVFAKKKNLRVLKIGNLAQLQDFVGQRFVEFKSLIDGGQIVQWSYVPQTRTIDGLLPATTIYKEEEYRVKREPTQREFKDLLFGWLVESGVTSNSVIYVKDECTVGIGTGEQDRVGVAEIARNKAYTKMADRLCWEKHQVPFNNLTDDGKKLEIINIVQEQKGGLGGACMVSDAFFPFRDGIEVGLREGVSAVIQPGGSDRDFESIQACNEYDAAMVFTGQRSFKH